MRLIDADDFLTQIAKRLEYIEQRREHLAKHLHFFMMDGAIAGELCRTIETIKNAPAIDAAPVAHARWGNETDDGYTPCTNCGWMHPMLDQKLHAVADAYCPCCGAKMDAKEDKS